jgi:hypothetical protein
MSRFKEALDSWTQGRLTQAEAALLPGQCERSFRRHIERYQADGLDGLLDKRLSQISKGRPSEPEVGRRPSSTNRVSAPQGLTL